MTSSKAINNNSLSLFFDQPAPQEIAFLPSAWGETRGRRTTLDFLHRLALEADDIADRGDGILGNGIIPPEAAMFRQ
jgi:hypothetical protein